VSRLRDSGPDFEGAVQSAAQRLGLAPLFVEKDYWVTQVLRTLHERYPGAFLLKGGTSLSKGYGLIERFSEDVDVLIQPTSGDSTKSRERTLRGITSEISRILEVDWLEACKPGRGKRAHRADVLRYPRVVRAAVAVPVENRGVLLETGFAEGEWPAEMVSLTPMLCEPLELDPDEYEDTAPFQVRALKPMRTLLEKLSLLHRAASCQARDATGDQRCGRHYYDVYRLLDHAATRSALADRARFRRIVDEMGSISAAQYGGWSARPDDGYAHSPAFTAPRSGELHTWLEQRYNDAAELLPARTTGRWPSFVRVLARVKQHTQLL
jgi:hypothetical protein